MTEKPEITKSPAIEDMKFKNLQLGIYEFLMAGKPEWDEELNAYMVTTTETAMAQLADDMGVIGMDLAMETAWDAIKRHMGSIVE